MISNVRIAVALIVAMAAGLAQAATKPFRVIYTGIADYHGESFGGQATPPPGRSAFTLTAYIDPNQGSIVGDTLTNDTREPILATLDVGSWFFRYIRQPGPFLFGEARYTRTPTAIGVSMCTCTPEDGFQIQVVSPGAFGGQGSAILGQPMVYDLLPGDFGDFWFSRTLPGNLTYLEGTGTISRVEVTNVPEPASWALMVGGFATLGVMLRRRRSMPA